MPGRPLGAEDGELAAVDDRVGVERRVRAELQVAGVAVGAEVQRGLAHLAPHGHRVGREDHLQATQNSYEWQQVH